MTTPQTPPADAVARLTKLADDYASRGDFATEDDIRTLLAAYADAARDREAMFTFGWDRAMTNVRLRQENPRHFWSFRDELADAMAKALAARTGEAR